MDHRGRASHQGNLLTVPMKHHLFRPLIPSTLITGQTVADVYTNHYQHLSASALFAGFASQEQVPAVSMPV